MPHDSIIERAADLVRRTLAGELPRPTVRAFFDEETSTASYVVHDPASGRAAILDSVLDFDPASGTLAYHSARKIAAHVENPGLTIDWLLETHVHADHLSAAPWLQDRFGGTLAIGRGVIDVQTHFGPVFNSGSSFARDGSQFDRLIEDGDAIDLGSIHGIAIAVPGHTCADVAFLIGDALFVGDTLFMPDAGTARTDFPGGDAAQLYRSIHRLFGLPDETRVFICHDYKAPGRDHFAWETTVAQQRAANVHVGGDINEAQFVAARQARDATLAMPRLILPSVQINMRAGHLPDAEPDGRRYLKIPIMESGR